ncbi:hypothetical protein HPB47_017322 [Ixodes persulcatus]|uniref:Uncharacterized protein n=1 Tax=Ixodes persulcatus TaxID=34615 RepID=A0AC60QPI3_IXOPE|nr:hypothetical protein HPB47_017322 [Ixodes persulcatus]
MGRRLRGRIPDFGVPASSVLHKHDQDTKMCRILPPLQRGGIVRLQADKGWSNPAQVQQAVAPRSYRVTTEEGRELRCNQQHLRKTTDDFQQIQEFDDRGMREQAAGSADDKPRMKGSSISSPMALGADAGGAGFCQPVGQHKP